MFIYNFFVKNVSISYLFYTLLKSTLNKQNHYFNLWTIVESHYATVPGQGLYFLLPLLHEEDILCMRI